MLLSNFYIYLTTVLIIFYFIGLFLYIKKIHKEEYSQKRELFLIITLFIFVLTVLYIGFLGKQNKQVELNQDIKEKSVIIKANIYVFQHKKYIKNKNGDYILIND